MKTETLGVKHTNKLFERFAPHSQDTQSTNVPKMKITMKKTSKKTNATVITMACKKLT